MRITMQARFAAAALLAASFVATPYAARADDHGHYDHYRHDDRHDDGHYRGGGGGGIGVGGVLLGVGIGALVGGAIAQSQQPRYAPPPPVYYAPPPPGYYAPPPGDYAPY